MGQLPGGWGAWVKKNPDNAEDIQAEIRNYIDQQIKSGEQIQRSTMTKMLNDLLLSG